MQSDLQGTSPRTVFLDSNALARLSIYLEFCSQCGLTPSDTGVDLQEGSPLWQKVKLPSAAFALENGIRQGQKLVLHLKQECGENPDILSCRLCEFELLHVLAERKANENLIQASIPYRLRRKTLGRLYLGAWKECDYQQITTELNEFRTRVSQEDMEYKLVEDSEGAVQDIQSIGVLISSCIVLETGDTSVYASALYAHSDEFVTYDRELSYVSKNLKTSMDSFWKKMREDLLKGLKGIGPSFRDLTEITLPDVWGKK